MSALPPVHRIVNALVIASVVAAWPTYLAIPIAILHGPAMLWPIVLGFLIALGHALVLGLPLYLVLARRIVLGPGIASLAGAAIGALPVTMLMLSSGTDFVVMPTLLFGICGGVGGAVFERLLPHEDAE